MCNHHTPNVTETSVDEDGRSACCGAYTSIFMDDGTEYCKCCYADVTAGAVTARTTVTL